MPKLLHFGITHDNPEYWSSPFFATYKSYAGQYLGMTIKNRQTGFWEFDDILQRNIPSLKDINCVMFEDIAKSQIIAAYEFDLDHAESTTH